MGGRELDDTHIKELVSLINRVQCDLSYIYTLDKKLLCEYRDEILRKCSGNMPLFDYKPDHFIIKDEVVKRIFVSYVSDYDDLNILENLLNYIIYEEPKLFEGEVLFTERYNISNAVYYFDLLKGTKGQEMPLDKIAVDLYNRGISVQYQPWHQNTMSVFFRVIDEDSANFHRFTFNLSGTVKQFSPTAKDEAYKFYFALMKTIEQIIDQNNYSLQLP